MRKFAFVILWSLPLYLFAQEGELGCYLSFDTKITELQDEYSTFSGLRFAVTMNHRYSIGLAGYGLEDNHMFLYTDNLGNTVNFKDEVNYGGLFVEFSFLNARPVHIAAPILIGGGRTTIKENVALTQYVFENASSREEDFWATVEESGFGVLEPGLALDTDLFKWMRLGIGVSYRYVLGNSLESLPGADTDLSGLSFDLTLKLGCL